MSWAAEEFETLDLGDARLNRRAVAHAVYSCLLRHVPRHEDKNSDGQAARHPADRARPAGTGAVGQEVTGLARPRAGQELAAAVPAHAQSRGGQGAEPQHLHRARDLEALAQRRHEMPVR